MEVVRDGAVIRSARDVHEALGPLDFGPYYGWNMAALRDRLTTDVLRPVTVWWKHADVSRQRLGSHVDDLGALFSDVARQDVDFGWDDRFTYSLE